MIGRIALALAVCGAPMVASGATVDVFIVGAANAAKTVVVPGGSYPVGVGGPLVIVTGPVEALDVSDSKSVTGVGDSFASLSTHYSVNGTTGQIRLGFEAEATPSADYPAYAGATATISVVETYRVVGGGKLTWGMELSAAWSAPSFYIVTGGSAGSNQSYSNEPINSFFTEPVYGTSGTGSVSKTLMTGSMMFRDDADDLATFYWSVQVQVNVGDQYGYGSAFLDMMNTANIFVQTEGNITATPLTPGFLSNPAYTGPAVAPVPLPASGLLFLAGLGGLAALRRGRCRSQAA